MILSAMALSVQDRSGSSHRRNDADLFEVSAKRDHLLLGAAGVALPFLSALAPSERFTAKRDREATRS